MTPHCYIPSCAQCLYWCLVILLYRNILRLRYQIDQIFLSFPYFFMFIVSFNHSLLSNDLWPHVLLTPLSCLGWSLTFLDSTRYIALYYFIQDINWTAPFIVIFESNVYFYTWKLRHGSDPIIIQLYFIEMFLKFIQCIVT